MHRDKNEGRGDAIICRFRIFVVLLLALMVCSIVLADHAPTQTPETQGLDTFTNVVVAGISTESEEIVWQESSRALNDPPLSLPFGTLVTPFGIIEIEVPGFTTMIGRTAEVQYVVSYSEDTLADQGITSYLKQNALDTRNQAANQDNLETDKLVLFEGSSTGMMTSDEDLLVDGAGQFERTNELFTCPFGSTRSIMVPPFCNIVEMGSSVAITDGVLSTTSGERTVAASGDVPVEADYSIQLSGAGQSAASGRADAYMKSHLMEGDMQLISQLEGAPGVFINQFRNGQRVDITYSEETTASGEIAYFRKDMQYESGLRSA